MVRRAHDVSLCPRYRRAIELIGRRWTGAILQVMRGGGVRFSDLAAAIPGLSDRMLSERLKELETERLIERRVVPETPARIEYRLTEQGEALGSVLDAVKAWAHTWLGEEGSQGTTEAPASAAVTSAHASAPRGLRRRRVAGRA